MPALSQDTRVVVNSEKRVLECARVLRSPLGNAKQAGPWERSRVPFGVNTTVLLPSRWEVSPGVPHAPQVPQFLRSPFSPSPDFLHLPTFCFIGTAYQDQLFIQPGTFPAPSRRPELALSLWGGGIVTILQRLSIR